MPDTTRLLDLLSHAPSGLSLVSLRRFKVSEEVLKQAMEDGSVTIEHYSWNETEEDRAFLVEVGKE